MRDGKSATAPDRPGAGPSDGELLERFNAGRGESGEAAFEGLVRRHGPMVLRVCGQVLGDRHGAEDAFQATFLVLARRSGEIRKPELLGNWLYGVALRTAWEAKMRDGRRRRREAPAEDVPHPKLAGDPGRPEKALIDLEESRALHEEVARLPERYRVPVVLCELEGLTYQEVARRMSCPVSTVGVRLVRARQQLRLRMIRRGIVPAAVLTEAIFGAEGASALVPAGLVESTVRAAAGFATSDAAAMGSISAAVFALAKAVLKARTLARLKAATGLALVVGAGSTVGWLGTHQTAPAPVAKVVKAVRVPGAAPKPAPEARPEPVAAEPSRPEVVEARPAALPALASLQARAREERTRGEVLFFKDWVAKDPMSPKGDGLGPVFNESSCVACHGLGAPGGAGPENKNVVILTAIPSGGRPLARNLERVHPGMAASRSVVLHRYGTDPRYADWRGHFFDAPDPKGAFASQPPEAQRAPIEPRTTRVHPKTGVSLSVSERNTPALFGAGRIDSIPSDLIAREAAYQPKAVRGRVARGRDGRVGRFGWKAQVPTLHEFVRIACAGEIGLEVPGHPQSASPLTPGEKARGVDMSDLDCDALVSYVRNLPAPVAVDPSGPLGTSAMGEGRRIFGEIGCATCHAPSLGEVRGIYSDLLLHDMGNTLSDTGQYYGFDDPDSPGATIPSEWRTPPLWGFRDSGPYLHDGRAEDLNEAVRFHGGQGTASAQQYLALQPEDRAAVDAFLKSLVAPSLASAPGILLASELEARVVPEEARQAEFLVRQQREEAEAIEIENQKEARKRQIALAAAKIAPIRLLMANNLEKAGRVAGALQFYRQIVREAPDTQEGRSAAERISALEDRK